ncbi:hypothetical protein AABB24_014439, partial [Solanum stoloniferum]
FCNSSSPITISKPIINSSPPKLDSIRATTNNTNDPTIPATTTRATATKTKRPLYSSFFFPFHAETDLTAHTRLLPPDATQKNPANPEISSPICEPITLAT